MRNSLTRNTRDVETLSIRRNRNVYAAGDAIEMVYVIDQGDVKLVAVSPTGRDCLLHIRTSGDILGESIYTGCGRRAATATAMRETRVKRMPRARFIERLIQERLLEPFIWYLGVQSDEQERIQISLATAQGERRLGDALLELARTIGTRADGADLRIAAPISHEELAAMIGTTRSRVSTFMQKFRRLDLVGSERDAIVVRERKLASYLDCID